jgi:hypothetical protein
MSKIRNPETHTQSRKTGALFQGLSFCSLVPRHSPRTGCNDHPQNTISVSSLTSKGHLHISDNRRQGLRFHHAYQVLLILSLFFKDEFKNFISTIESALLSDYLRQPKVQRLTVGFFVVKVALETTL